MGSCRLGAALTALVALGAGCGARSDLPGPYDEGVPDAPACSLALGLPASRVFPEIEQDSLSLFASFASTTDGDRACFLSFLRSEDGATNALHAGCLKGWDDLDRGADLVLGSGMDHHGSVSPASTARA